MNSRVMAVGLLLGGAVTGFVGTAPAMAQTEAAAPEFTVQIDGEYGPHLPPAVYKHGYGQRADQLINLLHYFMFALFGGWSVFLVYCLVRFRQRPGHIANTVPIKAKPSKWMEVGVAAVEAFLLIGVSIPAWASVKSDLPTEADNPVHVRVVAEQFAWNFHYPGPDGVFGKTAPQHIDVAINPVGIDPNDANGADDITSGELHFPVDRKVLAQVTSKDVIHCFSLPVLRVKQDVIPGMRIPVWFEAALTGNYEVACAQLCGNNHYSMRALMVIHDTDEAFYEWLESQKVEEFDEEELD